MRGCGEFMDTKQMTTEQGAKVAELTAQVALLREALEGAQSMLGSVGTEDPDDIETMAAIERSIGKITATLAATPESAGAELAELRKDKARLDFLSNSVEDVPGAYRAAIDAAMQQEAKG